MTAVTDIPAAPQAAAAPTSQEAAEQKAQQWAKDYLDKLAKRTESRLLERASAANGAPSIAGEAAFIVAFMFVNPVVDVANGFAVPAAVQLGGRQWRLTLDQLNLTTGLLVPQQVQTAAFSSPAPPLTARVFSLATPDPGQDPALIEANVTLDIADPAQPYAAFATNFFDVDDDPGFLFVPPNPPGWRHELPNRYLIYSK